MIETQPTDHIGVCDICLTADCGPAGVRVEGTPIAVGRTCVERLVAAVPAKITAPADVVPDGALPCQDCDRVFSRAAALASHRRSHKEAA